jgi:error-prone DNA polymerase
MLNNQPLGFYGPETLVKDAQRHGLRFLPVDICISGWETSLEQTERERAPCLRLGLNYVKALRKTTAEAIVAERAKRPFRTMQDLVTRVPAINRRELRNLSALGAFNNLGEDYSAGYRITRRDALWDAELVSRPLEPLFKVSGEGERSVHWPLKPMTEIERVMTDIRLTGMSIGKHPIRFVRAMLNHRGVVPVADLWKEKDGGLVEVAGLIICRQRPATATGIVFLSVEDETGIVNVVVMSDLFERERAKIVNSPAAYITGVLQNLEDTVSVRALSIEPLEMIRPKIKSHDFH